MVIGINSMFRNFNLIYRVLSFILFLIVLVYSIFVTNYQQILYISLIYLAANGFAYIYMTSNTHRGGISLMLYFFFTFFIALPAFVQISFDVFPWGGKYSPEELASAYIVLSLSQLSYFVGEYQVDKGWKRLYEKVVDTQKTVNVSSYWFFSIGIGGVCLFIILFLGSDILFLTRVARGKAELENVSQQLLFIGRSISLLGVIIILFLLRHQSFKKNIPVFISSAFFLVFVFVILNYPPGMSRFQMLGSVIACSAVFVNYFDRRIKILISILAISFLFFVFPIIKVFTGSERFLTNNIFARQVSDYLLAVDFDAFKQIVDTSIYLEDGSFRWGFNFLGVILFWVPRTLWPGKPINSGEIVSSSLGYPYNNVSNPLPAEALISFGFMGVVVVFYFLAKIIGYIELITSSSNWRRELYQSAFLYCMTMGFITIILRGGLNAVAPQFASGFLLFSILKLLHDKTSLVNIIRGGLS